MTEESESRKRLSFAKLFRLDSLIFIVAVLFYKSSLVCGSRQPDSILFYSFFYFLIGLSLVLSVAGVADLAKDPQHPFGWRTAEMVSISVVVGVALTFLSASLFPYYPAQIGFPLPFSQTMISNFGQSFTSKSPIAFLVDCVYWVSLVYPAGWFANLALSGRLKEVGRLDGIGVSAFLTYGSIPFIGALTAGDTVLTTALTVILPNWLVYSPAIGLALIFLPSVLVGILLTIKGYKALGMAVVLTSFFLVGLLLLLSFLAHMLAPPICPP